jgi:Fe-coproporphyrin III synthase
MLRRLLTHATNTIYNLPIVVLMPHSRCNCRCVMCDIWKANHEKKEIAIEELRRHVAVFKKLGVREVVLSGGEPLMHSNLWELCRLMSESNISITMLSTGLLLEKHAQEIVQHCNNVIISLDGPQEIHDRIRNIPLGFSKIEKGIKALRALDPNFKVTGRCVIQHHNFLEFIPIVRSAKAIGLNQISFLAADVTTSAFNHSSEKVPANEISLSPSETQAFEKILQQSFVELKEEYVSGFIAENPMKMLRILDYYRALKGLTEFPKVNCNAPWVSAVIESNGDVMPCYFHKPYGNIYDHQLDEVLNAPASVAFRKSLKVGMNEVCEKCVCSLKLGVAEML